MSSFDTSAFLNLLNTIETVEIARETEDGIIITLPEDVRADYSKAHDKFGITIPLWDNEMEILFSNASNPESAAEYAIAGIENIRTTGLPF